MMAVKTKQVTALDEFKSKLNDVREAQASVEGVQYFHQYSYEALNALSEDLDEALNIIRRNYNNRSTDKSKVVKEDYLNSVKEAYRSYACDISFIALSLKVNEVQKRELIRSLESTLRIFEARLESGI